MKPSSQWLGTKVTDRRSRILHCAQQVFAEKGFRAAEVQDIATAAGVSKATIYKHFRSKDEVLVTVVEENFAHIRQIMLANMIGPEQPMERLRKVLYETALYLDGNKAFCHVLVRDAGEFMGVIKRLYLDLVRETTPTAEAFFEHLRQRGEIPDIPTTQLLKLLTNAGIGVLYAWVLTDNGKLTDEVNFYFGMFSRLQSKWQPRTKAEQA